MTDYAVQANFSVPHSGSDYSKADLVNVQGDSVQEFHQNLIALNQHCLNLIAEVGANLRGVAAATNGLGGRVVEQSQNQPPQSPPQDHGGGYAQQQPSGPQNGSQQPQGGNVDPWTGQDQGPPPQWAGQGQGNGYGQPQGGYQQPQQQAPANNGVPTQPPPHVGAAPQCSHGQKKFIAKPYKGGKPGYWMAWACPARQGDPTQHELEFIRNS